MTRIVLKNINAVHKSGAKLQQVSLDIAEGEYVAVLGPTGAGPSEILKVVAGLLPVSNGTVNFDDVDVTLLPPEDRHIGMIFEQFNLFPHLSVLDNLLYGPRMRQANIQTKLKEVEEIISLVRLDGREHAISRELSGGMQQRVGIARAIVAGAKILLLDQPYRALDAKIRAEMRLEVRNIVKGLGITAIHSTHETEEAMLVADKIAVFNNGRLEQYGTPWDVFENPQTEFVATFLAESNVWDIQFQEHDYIVPQDSNMHIKYNRDKYPATYTRIVLRQHAIDLFFQSTAIPNEWSKFKGKITKVRLLGEFVRITVEVNGFTIQTRELLNPELEQMFNLVDAEIWIAFPIEEVKLF